LENLNRAELVETFNSLNQQIKGENYISPLMSGVSNLSKDDLAEMAESLINLTYLRGGLHCRRKCAEPVECCELFPKGRWLLYGSSGKTYF